jgi:hypothetical protein
MAGFFIYKALLKLKVDFYSLLIVVEGAKTPPKMLTHFHRAWAGSGKLNQCPAGAAGQVRPRRSEATEAQRQPRGKRSAWNENQQLCLTELFTKKRGWHSASL